jgi:hypothetical protein
LAGGRGQRVERNHLVRTHYTSHKTSYH